jgi:hypothetical protein
VGDDKYGRPSRIRRRRRVNVGKKNLRVLFNGRVVTICKWVVTRRKVAEV